MNTHTQHARVHVVCRQAVHSNTHPQMMTSSGNFFLWLATSLIPSSARVSVCIWCLNCIFINLFKLLLLFFRNACQSMIVCVYNYYHIHILWVDTLCALWNTPVMLALLGMYDQDFICQHIQYKYIFSGFSHWKKKKNILTI